MAGVITKFSTAMPDSLKKGDLIEICRKCGYCHWAVFIGDDYVIHSTSPRENSFRCVLCCEGKGEVKREKLSKVIGDSRWRINNSKDKLFKVLPDDEILKNAESVRDNPESYPDYHLLENNCEHFASYCRYGVAYSKQAKVGKHLGAKATEKVLSKISELSKRTHETYGRMTSEEIKTSDCFNKMLSYFWKITEAVQNIAAQIKTSDCFDKMLSYFEKITEAVQNIAAQIPCLNGVKATVSSAFTVWNWLDLVGLAFKILGCVLKQAVISQELGDTMNEIGNELMELTADGFLVSIVGAFVPAFKESEVVKGIAVLAKIILHICNGDYVNALYSVGAALHSVGAAVWPYIPAAIREKIEALPVALFNLTRTFTSWLSSVICSCVQYICRKISNPWCASGILHECT